MPERRKKCNRVRTGCWTCKKRSVNCHNACALVTNFLTEEENVMKPNQVATTVSKQTRSVRVTS